MRKFIVLLSILAIAAFSAPAYACFGPQCSDDVTSHVEGGFNGYDSDSLHRDAGNRGVSAFAEGSGAGDFSATANGKRFAHTFGGGDGSAHPVVGAIGGQNYVAVGAASYAQSQTYAGAVSDGGTREAYAAAYGGVYQSNGAYLDAGNGTGASGGNQSGANYFNADYDSYEGTWYPSGNVWKKWVNRGNDKPGHFIYKEKGFGWRPNPRSGWRWDGIAWNRLCLPGMEFAATDGSAFTAGGTFLYAENYDGGAASFGATGSLSVGNNGVYGDGSMLTSTFAEKDGSSAGALTSGSYSYGGNGFGAGATFGGSQVSVGAGHASVHATHTSIATGGGSQVDRPQ